MTTSRNNIDDQLIYDQEAGKSFKAPLCENPDTESGSSERKQLALKLLVFVLCIGVLIGGRSNVPDNEPECIQDNLMNLFNGVNNFILHNSGWRNTMQIMTSLVIDILFLSTGGYWVLYSRSSRLIITILIFFGVRMAVQHMWYSPFPSGFWWYDPGFPSLVVPYGRGSDFFFSGHIGFILICGTEWKRNGFLSMYIFAICGAIFTTFVLLSYQVHYSIDIFTGLIFAHWCFMMVEGYQAYIDQFFVNVYVLSGNIFKRGNVKTSHNHYIM